MTGSGSIDGTDDERIAVTAALLALLSPELGHLYLRKWLRATAWTFATLVLLAVFAPDAGVAAIVTGDAYALMAAVGRRPVLVVLGAVAIGVRVGAALDAWLLARRGADGDVGGRCRTCSRRVDPELEFCHWCLDGKQ